MNISPYGNSSLPAKESTIPKDQANNENDNKVSTSTNEDIKKVNPSHEAGLTIGEEQKQKMVENALKALTGPDRKLEVSIHDKTHMIMVKVLNKDTGELIREVPPEKTLDAIAKLMEVAGILIDKKV